MEERIIRKIEKVWRCGAKEMVEITLEGCIVIVIPIEEYNSIGNPGVGLHLNYCLR